MPPDDSSIGSIIDLERYPIGAAEGREIRPCPVAAPYRRDMQRDGVAILAGFVRPDAVAAMRSETLRLEPVAHFSETFSNPYLGSPDTTRQASDPRSRSQRAALSAVAFDEFGTGSPLLQLYESGVFRRFLADVLDVDVLHRYADPLGALSLAVMRAGDELGWHFDFSEFVISVGIRPSTEGGTFDVVPNLRTDSDPNEAGVMQVLAGTHPGVVTLPMEPGTLMIFAGRNSIHRVAPVGGPTARHVALLSYDTRPGTDSTEQLKRIRYGRTTAHARPETTAR